MFNRIKSLIGSRTEPGQPAALTSNPDSASSSETGKSEPVSLQHVYTSEANAVKLRSSRMIMPLGETRSYSAPDQAQESPLAQALFEIKGVTGIHLDSVSVQVTMDESADWDALMERIPEVIRGHLEAGLSAVEGLDPVAKSGAVEKKYSFGFRQVPEGGRTPEEQKAIVQKILDEEINPAVAAHGGFFNLISVENNNVYVQLGGGCQGCGMVDVTLRQGVEQRLKEVLPEMIELIDTTDHRSGSNPYYQPGK